MEQTDLTLVTVRLGMALSCVVLAAVTACDGGVACLEGSYPAISARVTSAADGSPLVHAFGEVRDRIYRDSLVGYGDGQYFAAYDRGGTYALHVEHTGYTAWDTTGVLVRETGGPCSTVETQNIDVPLHPAP